MNAYRLPPKRLKFQSGVFVSSEFSPACMPCCERRPFYRTSKYPTQYGKSFDHNAVMGMTGLMSMWGNYIGEYKAGHKISTTSQEEASSIATGIHLLPFVGSTVDTQGSRSHGNKLHRSFCTLRVYWLQAMSHIVI